MLAVDVVVTLIATGSIADYGTPQQHRLRASMASGAGVSPSSVSLGIEAASVLLTFAICSISVGAAAETTTRLDTLMHSAAAASDFLQISVESKPEITLMGSSSTWGFCSPSTPGSPPAPIQPPPLDPRLGVPSDTTDAVSSDPAVQTFSFGLYYYIGFGVLMLLACVALVVACILLRRSRVALRRVKTSVIAPRPSDGALVITAISPPRPSTPLLLGTSRPSTPRSPRPSTPRPDSRPSTPTVRHGSFCFTVEEGEQSVELMHPGALPIVEGAPGHLRAKQQEEEDDKKEDSTMPEPRSPRLLFSWSRVRSGSGSGSGTSRPSTPRPGTPTWV